MSEEKLLTVRDVASILNISEKEVMDLMGGFVFLPGSLIEFEAIGTRASEFLADIVDKGCD